MLEVTEKTFFVNGPVGRIETVAMLPDNPEAVAIVCHPHPLYDGSMNNKVTYTLARTLRDQGAAAFRFNFRGVGHSQGVYGEGDGEVEDLLAVVRYAQRRFSGRPLWLAGFSFGAYICLRAAPQLELDRLITVAPPVNFFGFMGLGNPNCPWLLIQGEDDEVVPADKVCQWVDMLETPPDLVLMPGVGHFFHRQLNTLRSAIEQRFQARSGLRVAVG